MTILLFSYLRGESDIVASRFGRGAFGVVFAFLLPFSAIGQQPKAPLPSAAQPQPGPELVQTADARTIKTRVRQVLLDVVVTDSNNHPVTGLHQRDFSVLEDGKPQQIRSLEAHVASDAAPPGSEPPKLPELPPNTFLNLSPVNENLPLNILLYDVLNTPIDDQPFAHKEIVKFLKSKPAGSRFAIFLLSNKLHLLQGFTDDENQLISAMNRKETNPNTTPLSPAPATEPTPSEFLSDSGVVPNYAGPLAMMDRLGNLESMASVYFLTRRVETTLSAFVEISRFLNGLPGRKNLIWLSGSFPAGVLPGGTAIDLFAATPNYTSEMREAVDRLTLSQVAVYPVDIRGLTVDPVYAAANSRTFRAQGSLARASAKFMQELTAEHDAMDEIAQSSGGHAFYNTNGLEHAVATATVDGANYYTLSYSPANTKFDGSLRRIRVHLAQKGCHLSYRRSYFADDESSLKGKATEVPHDHVDATMQRGAPLARELIITAHVAPEGAPALATPDQIDQLLRFPAFASQKKWDTVRIQGYAIDYAVLGKQLTFVVPADGVRRGNLEFLFAAYDADSNLLLSTRSSVDETLPPKLLEQVRAGAFRARQRIDIPAQAAWLRLAVRDAVGNRIGSLEIPLPLAAEPPAQSQAVRH